MYIKLSLKQVPSKPLTSFPVKEILVSAILSPSVVSFRLELILLYLIVKNHSFVDGNKPIAAACFLYFLKKNNILYSADGRPFLSNDALASLTLFIAESKSDEMETVKQVTISILNMKNL